MVRRAIPRLLRRAVAATTAAAYLATTLAPLHADEMRAHGQEAQSFGLAILPDMGAVAAQPDPETLRLWPDSAAPADIDLDELFPGDAAGAPVDPATLFGEDDALRAAAAAAAGALGTATTPQAEAWRAVTDARSRAGVDIRDDPLFAETRALVGSLDTLVAEFSACVPETGFAPRDVVTRATREARCLRALAPSRTETVRHRVDVATAPLRLELTAPGPAVDVRVDFLAGEAVVAYETLGEQWRCSGGDGGEFSGGQTCEWVMESGLRETRMAAPRLDGDAFCGPDARQVLSVMQESARLGDEPRALGPGAAPDCANGLVYAAPVAGPGCFVSTRVVGRDGDEVRETVCPSSRITLQLAVTTVTEDAWEPADVVDGLSALEAAGCAPAYTTVAGGQPGDDGCLELGGGRICPGDAVHALLDPAPFDPGETRVSRLATQVTADLSTCAPVVPVAESCAPLRADPGCSFRTTLPVEGTEGPGGAAMFEDIYDCETARTVRSVAAVGGLSCPPPVRGVGDDLVTPLYETNASFAEVAARLSAAQFMGMDASCGGTDPGADPLQCRVFEGERRGCDVGFFGVVDCCANPGGVSLAQYLSLAFAVGEVDGALAGVGIDTPLRGAWEVASAPFSDAWGLVSRQFASGVNSITGATVFNATDAAAKGLVGSVQQALVNDVAKWTARTFGEAAGNALFNVGGGKAFSGGALLGDAVLGPAGALGAALGWVMTAYTAYQVALLLIQIIWACSGDELQTAVKRELRACRDLGTYCTQSVFGVCLNRRRSFCCFNSPLSRIMQEQIRLQTGVSWGTAREPDCSGLTVDEMQAVDFASIDLSEWLDILLDADVLPDGADVTADLLTGSGHAFAGALPAGQTRSDALDRTLGRAEGLDFEAIGRDARERALGDLAR